MLRGLVNQAVRQQCLAGRSARVAHAKPFTAAVRKTPVCAEQDGKGRPISPHVTIYAFPTIAISSITNRACGVGLSVGMAGCGALTLLGVDVPTMMYNLGHGDLTYLFKFGVGFPLIYHYAAGIRHLYWDNTVQGFTNSDMESSSMMLMGSTLLLGGIVAFI